MRKLISCTATFVFIVIIFNNVYSQTTIITDDSGYSTGESSSVLDVKSTERGFLPPRMTTAQRDIILNPVDGLMIYNTDTKCINYYTSTVWFIICGKVPYPAGFVHCNDPTEVSVVTNPLTGKYWMDRNHGASRVATSKTDALAYGDLYQWGRFGDGHQCRDSETTSTLSSSDTPGHGDFITPANHPYDWLSPQNSNLWQGLNGTNNPCPEGFRIPTEAEWMAESDTWSPDNSDGAYASPLKLTMAGHRHLNDGSLVGVDDGGYYWSGTVNSNYSQALGISDSNINYYTPFRAYGNSVRCIKD